MSDGVMERRALKIEGTVQGLGFRPHVYRVAKNLGLCGYVLNTPWGVEVEVEGPAERLDEFQARLQQEKPALATLDRIETTAVAPLGDATFEIRQSNHSGKTRALVLPEIATCPACLSELESAADRRFGYAFTNCTHCGPRFSIISALPYDRPNTTMRGFEMCDECSAEYSNPGDRRFHAQPNACPRCGPKLWFSGPEGLTITDASEVIAAAVATLRSGKILAVKGLGGLHLFVDATREDAVKRLRARKCRWEKPLAVMAPSLEHARRIAQIDERSARELTGPSAPILLLKRHIDGNLAPSVAPSTPRVGLMLPYSPLHHLVLQSFGGAVVATSGNLSEEPICIENAEALSRLGNIADAFILHDRPIERHIDDSVAQFCGGALQLLRRARGYAPLPLTLVGTLAPTLAFGGQQKNTVALGLDQRLFLSQHIGDLGTTESLAAHQRVAEDLPRLYATRPRIVAHDAHPDYVSTQTARHAAAKWDAVLVPVQHHHAHLVACMLDSGLDPLEPALGVIWDGAGFGPDETIWGGEFLIGNAQGFARVGHLLPFRLPGGDSAAREPRRCALSLLHSSFGEVETLRDSPALAAFSPGELRLMLSMVEQGVRSPLTTSAGRLFDGLAAMLDLGQKVSFEGQAAMALEHLAAAESAIELSLPLASRGAHFAEYLGSEVFTNPPKGRPGYALPASKWTLDWRPLVREVHELVLGGSDPGQISLAIHRTLAQGIKAVADGLGARRVLLSGGCFQNRLLSTLVAGALGSREVKVIMHQQIPPNDGGLSAGQAAIAAAVATPMR